MECTSVGHCKVKLSMGVILVRYTDEQMHSVEHYSECTIHIVILIYIDTLHIVICIAVLVPPHNSWTLVRMATTWGHHQQHSLFFWIPDSLNNLNFNQSLKSNNNNSLKLNSLP